MPAFNLAEQLSLWEGLEYLNNKMSYIWVTVNPKDFLYAL